MSTYRDPHPTNRHASPLDPSLLGVATVASVCSAIVASACGTGPVATLLVAALAPWITAFISHNGPRRHRRVGAVLLLAGLVQGGRTGLAKAATSVRPGRKRRQPRTPRTPSPRSVARLGVRRRVWLTGATAGAAVTITVACLTLPELVLGSAIVADRPLTLLPRSHAAPDTPELTARGKRRSAGPTLEIPGGDVRRRASGPRGARVTYHVIAYDAHRQALTPACRPASGGLFPIGLTRVTCDVTQANGLRARRAFSVTVIPAGISGGAAGKHAGAEPPPVAAPGNTVVAPRDEHAPELSLPATVRARAGSPAGAVVRYAVRAVDGRDGVVAVSCVPASGSHFDVGPTRVRCTATDRSGNSARDTFSVVVSLTTPPPDTTGPRIHMPGPIREPATSRDGAVVRYRVSATDDRDGATRVSCTPASGARFSVGSTRVRCTATDRAGNASADSFAIIVWRTPDGHRPDPKPDAGTKPDRDAPKIEPFEIATVVADESAKGATVRYATPTANDDRDERVPVECAPPSGTWLDVGSHTVTCTARDKAGNEAQRTATATVDLPPDRTPPTIRAFKIAPVVGQRSEGRPDGAVVTYTAPVASDDRDGSVPVECAPTSGTWLEVGRHPVICTAHDKAGNDAQRTVIARVDPVPSEP